MQAGIVVLSISCIATGVWPQLLAPLLHITLLSMFILQMVLLLKLVA